MTNPSEGTWHVLDVSSIPVEELASALNTLVPTLGWTRQNTWFASLRKPIQLESRLDPPLSVARFERQRGVSTRLVDTTFRFAKRLTAKLLAQTQHPANSPLICTSPFYASVAELWPGPVIYYSTDLTAAYDHLSPRQVRALDRRLCLVASLVFPNSARIAEYLVHQAGCSPAKIVSLPNATRDTNIVDVFSSAPSPLPADLGDLPRPIAGVIGNHAANIDWILLEKVIQKTPWLSWAFVGPTEMHIQDRQQRFARSRVMRTGPRIRFVGFRRYSTLKDYARSFDVAVLPYFRREPTFSGSATRFYDHLAACRPMLATRGVHQLLTKEPLLRLVDGPEQMLGALADLRAASFADGFERIRWSVSRTETWSERARTMLRAVGSRHPTGRAAEPACLATPSG